MIQYKKPQRVTATIKRGGHSIEINGYVHDVLQSDNGLQCLIIYGKSSEGETIRARVYNDDISLQLITDTTTAPNPHGADDYATPADFSHLNILS